MNRLERLENLSAHIDGELTDAEQQRLAAWCDNHPEDLEEFEGILEVVRLVRELPEAEPPVSLRSSILRAAADAAPVTATRQQAMEWLDRYFDDDLAAPQRAVVEHYLAVDAEFAETAEVHRAMLTALADVDEVDPPAELGRRIRSRVTELETRRGARKARRPVRGLDPQRLRRVLTLSAAAALLVALGALLGRTAAPQSPTVARDPRPPVAVPGGGADTVVVDDRPVAGPGSPVVDDGLPADTGVPELPADDGREPVVDDGMDPTPAPAESTRPVAPVNRAPSAGQVADDDGRTPAQPAPRARRTPREPARRPAPSPQSAAPRRTPPKSTPVAAPAPLPAESGGALASPTGVSSAGSGGMIDASGAGSVLGSDNKSGGADELGTGGAPNPTRRTEAPPF